jgi:predicted aconitase
LFHAVGVTPEAPTLEAALGGAAPEEVHRVGMAELRRAREQLSTAAGGRLDLVILGSPHFSLPEFRRLVPRLMGKPRDPRVQFIVTTSRFVLGELDREGLRPPLDDFGVRLMTDTCILNFPTIQNDAGVTVCMTNSGKYAHYIPGQIGKQVVYGSTADCVASAVAGRVVRDDELWNA